jgi:SAM-dependent methyltransferase
MMKLFYEVVYRYFRAPWDIGARRELVALVDSGRIEPGKAIDLGCGAGANAIYLAQQGFDVTGVDYANAAIETARLRALDAGIKVKFVVDDLTNLQKITGKFDFLLDYGVLDDLRRQDRDLYLQNMLALTQPGSCYLLWGFEYPLRWWERLLPFYDLPFKPGEIESSFGPYFDIEKVAGELDWSRSPPGYAAYLMTRRGETL